MRKAVPYVVWPAQRHGHYIRLEVHTMRRLHWIALALLVSASILTVSGCKDERTMISKILQRPDRYEGHEVRIAGEVTKTYSVNLLIAEAGAYQLDDGSGKLWVITRTGVPHEGQEVGLKGKVGSGFRLGSEAFGVVVREEERRTR